MGSFLAVNVLHKSREGGVFKIRYKNSHHLKSVPVIVGRLEYDNN